MPQNKNRNSSTIAENRRARFDYVIEDTLEAGLVLTGSEVKALRNGKARITESYASVEAGELWLINADIATYKQAGRFNHEPKRKRKLLVSKREYGRLAGVVERSGRTIVPLRLYFNERGLAKLLIGVAVGKKTHDKRQIVAKRDWDRQKARILKNANN